MKTGLVDLTMVNRLLIILIFASFCTSADTPAAADAQWKEPARPHLERLSREIMRDWQTALSVDILATLSNAADRLVLLRVLQSLAAESEFISADADVTDGQIVAISRHVFYNGHLTDRLVVVPTPFGDLFAEYNVEFVTSKARIDNSKEERTATFDIMVDVQIRTAFGESRHRLLLVPSAEIMLKN